MSDQKSPANSSKARSFLTFAAGTVVTILGSALIIQYCIGKSQEHMARLAAGESDFQRHHPKKG